MVSSIIIYGCTALSTALFAEISTKAKEKVVRITAMLITLFIPAFLAGIRYGIGTDYFRYKLIFDNIRYGYVTRHEIGYGLINYFVGLIGGNIQTVFFIVSFLTILFVYLTLYDLKDKISLGIGMLVFMLLYYQMSFNVVRQVLAMSVSMFSIRFIYKRQLMKFLIFVLLATSFHLSSMVIVPFFFIYNIIGTKKRVIVHFLFFISVLVFMINFDRVLPIVISKLPNPQYYSGYLFKRMQSSFGFGVLILNLPYLLPGIVFFDGLRKYDGKFMFYFDLFCTGFILKFLGYITVGSIDRIADFFFISIIIIIPFYYKIIKKYKGLGFLNYYMLAFVIFMWFFTYIYAGSGETVPYQSIFSYIY